MKKDTKRKGMATIQVTLRVPREFSRFEERVLQLAHEAAQNAVDEFEADCLYEDSALHASLREEAK